MMNDESFFDDLGLTEAITEYFRMLSSKGAQAEIVYVDVGQYENAYSIRGLYRIQDGVLNLRGRLYKGKSQVGEPFQVSGKEDKLPALVETIVEKVSGML